MTESPELRQWTDTAFMFSQPPCGDPKGWNWSYSGVLAGAQEARELNAERLTQVDIARGSDGRLLLVATPDDWVAAAIDSNHMGCVVLEITSLDKPTSESGIVFQFLVVPATPNFFSIKLFVYLDLPYPSPYSK